MARISFLVVIVFFVTLPHCKKYEEDEKITLKTPKQRLVGAYGYGFLKVDGKDPFKDSLHKPSTYELAIGFGDDFTFRIYSSVLFLDYFPLNNLKPNSNIISRGVWNFINNDNKLLLLVSDTLGIVHSYIWEIQGLHHKYNPFKKCRDQQLLVETFYNGKKHEILLKTVEQSDCK